MHPCLLNPCKSLGTNQPAKAEVISGLQQNGQHHITIPNHNPLKIETLNILLTEMAQHLGVSKQELIERLF